MLKCSIEISPAPFAQPQASELEALKLEAEQKELAETLAELQQEAAGDSESASDESDLELPNTSAGVTYDDTFFAEDARPSGTVCAL